jgi:phasin family protein
MYNASEQFAEMSRTNVEQATRFAALTMENTEKLINLNMNAAKAAIAHGIEGASAVASVKDVKELFSLPSKYAESGVQYTLGFSRGLYEVVATAQAQYSALAEEALAGYTKGLASWVEKASESAPAGSDVAFSAMKSTVAATTAAIDQFQKATKQVVNLADASVRAAADNASRATSAKSRKAA